MPAISLELLQNGNVSFVEDICYGLLFHNYLAVPNEEGDLEFDRAGNKELTNCVDLSLFYRWIYNLSDDGLTRGCLRGAERGVGKKQPWIRWQAVRHLARGRLAQ
ncbi:MAG: hypothetical protein AB8B50_06940 [Pirellulaceae bacterium]